MRLVATAGIFLSGIASAALALFGGGAGCGKAKANERTASPLLHATAHDDRVDLARAAHDPDTLRRALVRPHHVAALGAHRFEATSKLRVTEAGTEVEALDVSEAFDQAASGAYHIVVRNSKDYGREVFFVPGGAAPAPVEGDAGFLWIRPGFGKFHHRRPAEPDEPSRLLDETFGSFGADFDVVAHAATVTDAGATTVAGRAAHKISLSLGTARPRVEPLPERAWRAGVTVQALSGEVALDDATGAPLAGTLSAKATFVREGHTYEMTLEATHTVKDVGAEVAIPPPAADDSVDTPGRSHDFEDREELLRGIAPPAKRGTAAAPPSTGKAK